MAKPEEMVDTAARECARDQARTPNRMIKVKVDVDVYEITPRVVKYVRMPDVDVNEVTPRVLHYVRKTDVEVYEVTPRVVHYVRRPDVDVFTAE